MKRSFRGPFFIAHSATGAIEKQLNHEHDEHADAAGFIFVP